MCGQKADALTRQEAARAFRLRNRSLEVRQDLRADPPPLKVLTHGISQQSGDALVRLPRAPSARSDEVLAIQERLIQVFGGPPGVRDRGLPESALFRPQTGSYGDLAAMAAALFESLLMNRAFLDGNKRVGFFAAGVFLRLNGFRMEVEPDAAHRFLVALLESRTSDFEHLLPWIRRSLKPNRE